MLTNSRDIVRRLEREGWTLLRITGSLMFSRILPPVTYMVALVELRARVHAAE